MKALTTRRALPATLAIAALAATIGYAQVSTASIQGTVRDSSGAAIPAAAIVLHNSATNVETNTSSTAQANTHS